MRILAIGLGGAGCRIVDRLYSADRRGSRVVCVQALAIDIDESSIVRLKNLPESSKICFSPLNTNLSDKDSEDIPTATIDIGEIIARVQNLNSGETDAIIFFCGTGGNMTDIAPHVIGALRQSVVEPVFALVTLPCLAEGERISGKAAEDIEMLSPLVDGMILFDNETWYKKVKAKKSVLRKKTPGFAERFGLKKEAPELSSADATYDMLNEAIVRRISLILKAGEFRADGGLDLAEVVLDSGEVLNTMKGMGYITIGDAVEHLPYNPLNFLTKFRPTAFFTGEHQKRTSRIIELAKQAIYHEISTPCDMTSAHKSLILVAGPSHELSMKGYLTVRKWIDRSIAGIETRSGDYPVTNTKYVAIIIMLSGLENIPRLTELKEIREQYKSSLHDTAVNVHAEIPIVSGSFADPDDRYRTIVTGPHIPGKKQKEKIIPLPHRSISGEAPGVVTEDEALPAVITESGEDIQTSAKSHRQIRISPDIPKEGVSSASAGEPLSDLPGKRSEQRHRVSVLQKTDEPDKDILSRYPPSQPASSPAITDQVRSAGQKTGFQPAHASTMQGANKERERQHIEKELQRQRMIAISGQKQKNVPDKTPQYPAAYVPEKPAPVYFGGLARKVNPESTRPDSPDMHELPKKTVIRTKKKGGQPHHIPSNQDGNAAMHGNEIEDMEKLMDFRQHKESVSQETRIGLKDIEYRARDDILEGKPVTKSQLPHARDSALVHTDIKKKKSSGLVRAKDQAVTEDSHADAGEMKKKVTRILKRDGDHSP